MLAPFLAGFRSARIPVKVLHGAIDPRSRHVFQLDIFRHEYVRLWPGASDTQFEVLDADASWRQVVLRVQEPRRRYEQVIAQRWWSERAPMERLAAARGGRVLRGGGRHWVLELFTSAESRRYLCGFDERLFIAQLTEGDTVAAAHEALKPDLVRNAGSRGVRRQGEWFFIEVTPDETIRLEAHADRFHRAYRTREPIEDSERPHAADELVRMDLRERQGRLERRTMAAYARGTIRHADHVDLVLPRWHRIARNRAVVPAEQDRTRLRWID